MDIPEDNQTEKRKNDEIEHDRWKERLRSRTKIVVGLMTLFGVIFTAIYQVPSSSSGNPQPLLIAVIMAIRGNDTHSSHSSTPTPDVIETSVAQTITAIAFTKTPTAPVTIVTPQKQVSRTPSATRVMPTQSPSSTLTPLPPLYSEYIVDATQRWTETDISVEAGDTLLIEYESGKWSGKKDDGTRSFVRPGGNGPADEFACIPIPQHDEPNQPGTGPNALIGRIGRNGDPFRILTYTNPNIFRKKMTVSGELYLQMNDCADYFYDNEGSITIYIEVS